MTLKELRKNNRLTQKEASSLIGIPYRTYIRYEENESYRGSFKYNAIYSKLEGIVRIDEDKGILSIQSIKEIVVPILKSKDISFCYLFGSYAKGKPKENSDVDLLVDTDITGLEFLNLIENLRTSLHKRVDLLRLKDIKPENPIALEILKDGIKLL